MPDPFVGTSEMAALMRTIDWASTPLGPVEGWPQSLRTTIGTALASGFPYYIAWGPEYVQLYNDAFRPILGASKHPAAMGAATRETFAEIWEAIGPMFDSVVGSAQHVDLEDGLFPLDRNGFLEECYFTFSYSPIRDETGDVGGVLVTCMETSGRVRGQRRLQLLRELASAASGSESAIEAAEREVEVLRTPGARFEIPFALLYLLDDDERLRLSGATGIAAGDVLAPAEPEGAALEALPWRLEEVLRERHPIVVEDLVLGDVEGHPWPEPVTRAVALPIARPGQDALAGVLVAGTSPRLALDDEYRGFLDLVAGQVGTAIADARAYAEERRRAESLAALDRAKTAFFSDVSHEFRTPLTLLLGPLEALLEDPSSLDPAVAADLSIARRNGLRLLKLVNTLLDFSRIEAGRVEAAYEPTDLAALTEGLASVFRSAVERAGLELAVDCPTLPEPVHVDPEMWEKIVLNLLSNALKFTFQGRIEVSLRAAGDAAELRVSDTGVGIPRQEQARVFERFHRVRGARSRTHEGTGIGLALVQELVRLQGGTIALESEPGAGSTFTVRIPLGTAHLPDAARTAGDDRSRISTRITASAFTEEAMRWLPGSSDAAQAPGAGAPDGDVDLDVALLGAADAWQRGGGPTRVEAHGARILVADDNADMRDYLARLLGPTWRVETVPDGATALARAEAEPPDLLLADVMMPGLDGLELLDGIRSRPAIADLPVVLLSARAGEEARIEGLQRGADDYLVKPFSARELVARVGAQLQLAAQRRVVADEERSRAARAGRLATASVAINAAATLEEMLDVTTREARATIGAHMAVTSLTLDRSWSQSITGVSLSDRYRDWREYAEQPDGTGIYALACETNRPLRLTQEELEAHPRWRGFGPHAASHPPIRGLLAAPLIGRDGRNLGVIQVSDRNSGDFTAEDEASLVQFAQVASIALERMQIDQQRRDRERQQAATARFGQRALTSMLVEQLLDEACRTVGECLGTDFTKVLELLPGGEALRMAAGVGWQPGLAGTAVVPAGLDSQAGYTLSAGEPVIVEDLATEPRFSGPQLLRDHGVVSGMSVVIGGPDQPFGVLGTHTKRPRRFTRQDIDFLQTMANVLAAALERDAAEQRLASVANAEYARASELRAVLEAMRDGVIVLDAGGRVVLRNAAAEEVLGSPAPDAIALAELLEPGAGVDALAAASRGPIELPLRGSDRWVEVRRYEVPAKGQGPAELPLGAIVVVRDVTEERTTRTLREAFISVVSHELRTPITTIYAGSKLLGRPAAAPGPDGEEVDRTALIGDIEAEADRLFRLVEDLLVLTRFERGALDYIDEPVLLQRVLAGVVRSESARWPDARFELHLPADLPSVRADPTFVEQIARNLLTNAAKYGEPGGTVDVSADVEGDEVVVRVQDSGPGIPHGEAGSLFELFYRSPTVKRKPGAGIGLFVAKRLTEIMGGRIWATARQPRGAEFGFALRASVEG